MVVQDMENYSLMKLIRDRFIKYQFLNMQIWASKMCVYLFYIKLEVVF